jgi:hypothetical protein
MVRLLSSIGLINLLNECFQFFAGLLIEEWALITLGRGYEVK